MYGSGQSNAVERGSYPCKLFVVFDAFGPFWDSYGSEQHICNKGWLFTGGIIADIRNPERVIAIVASYLPPGVCILPARGPANSIRVEIYILGFL